MIDKRLKQISQDEVFALLRRFWYDNALSPGEQTWGCLENVAAPDQIVFGTDWPFANASVTAEAMKTYEALDADHARAARRDRPRQCAAAVSGVRVASNGATQTPAGQAVRHCAGPHRADHAAGGAPVLSGDSRR